MAAPEYNAAEPTRKGRRFAQVTQVAIRFQKGFLCRILRRVGITQHGIGAGKSHILKTDHDLAKGGAVTALCGSG